MGDLPEPKAQGISRSGPAFADRSLQKDVASRQDRRLSHMVGLDQVRKLLFITYFTADKNSRSYQLVAQIKKSGLLSIFVTQ